MGKYVSAQHLYRIGYISISLESILTYLSSLRNSWSLNVLFSALIWRELGRVRVQEFRSGGHGGHVEL
jgi:hypothetical protein